MNKTMVFGIWAKNAEEARKGIEKRGYTVLSVKWLKSFTTPSGKRKYKVRARKGNPCR